MQNGMMLETSLEPIGIEEIQEPGLQIDSFLEPIDMLLQEGKYDLAYRFLKILRPWQQRQWVDERLGLVYRKLIPRWHFEMLNDSTRGQAFADAMDVIDLRGKTVLDIGTGSGLLAMLAVRSGARHVYACEMVEPVAEAAEEIICRNGMADRITIIPKKSSDVEIGREIPEPADVMVSETFDSGLVGEGFLPSLDHARNNLLRPNAQLVPCAAQLCGMLIESPQIHHMNRVGRSHGFDVSRMNEFASRGYFRIRLKTRPHRVMSEVKTLIDLDLYEPAPEVMKQVIEFQALQNGVVHGAVFWFKVTLVPGIDLSTDPDQLECHWPQAFATFPEPMTVEKGVCYRIQITFRLYAMGQHGIVIAPLGGNRVSL